MKYARIDNGLVMELFETDGDITQMFPPILIWVEITNLDPQPEQGWSYDGANFTAPPPYIPDPRPALYAELEQIDRESTRPLRAMLVAEPNVGVGTPERADLEAKELRAIEIRAELSALGDA